MQPCLDRNNPMCNIPAVLHWRAVGTQRSNHTDRLCRCESVSVRERSGSLPSRDRLDSTGHQSLRSSPPQCRHSIGSLVGVYLTKSPNAALPSMSSVIPAAKVDNRDRRIRSHLDEDRQCRKLSMLVQQYQCVKSTHSVSGARRERSPAAAGQMPRPGG